MSKKLASLLIKISANGAEAEKQIRSLEKKLGKLGDSVKKIGSAMTKYVTGPLVAAAAAGVAAADTQLKAEAKLLNALKGREDIQRRLMAQASEIQSRSIFGDEAIIDQQAYLAAMGLTERQISDTIEAAIQLSSATGVTLEGAVKNLAKTYAGLTGELGETMPALKQLTKEQLIAGEAIRYINDNYKGFAETAARTGAGPLTQLKNKLGDLAEKIGTALIPFLNRLIEIITPIIDGFNNMSPAMQKTIVVVGGVVAAIGPLLMAIGSLITIIPTLSALCPMLGAAFTAMTGPIGIVVTAVGGLIIMLERALSLRDRLESERKQAYETETQSQWSDHYNTTASTAKGLSDEVLNEYLEETRKEWAEFKKQYGEDKTKYDSKARRRQGIIYYQELALVDEINRRAKLANTTPEATPTPPPTTSSGSGGQKGKGLIPQLQREIAALEQQLMDATSKEQIARINTEIEKLKKELADLNTLKVHPEIVLVEKVQGSGPQFGVSGPKITSLIKSYEADLEGAMERAKRIESIAQDVAGIVTGAFESIAVGIAEQIGNLISGEEFRPVSTLLNILGQSLKEIGKAMIVYSGAIEAVKAIMVSILALPGGPAIAFGIGVAAIASGQALINAAAKMPKLAKGGLAYGPTLAVVGDNPGASSDPEVIAPLSKLRNYMSGQRMELVGEIQWELSGDKLKAVLDRNNVRLATLG